MGTFAAIGAMVTARRGGTDLAAAIRALFASSEVGVWYDPSDLTSMFQDSAGTTASAAGQVMGLVLDKSQGMVLGSELNSGFVAYTANGTSNTVDGVTTATCTTNGTYGIRFNTNLCTGLKTYLLTFEVVTNSAARAMTAFPNLNHAGLSVGTAPVVKTYRTYAPSTTGTNANLAFVISGGVAGESFSVRLVSMKELAGYHATQATTGNKPLWQTTYAELDAFDDYMTSATGGGGTTGFLFAAAIRPSGTGTARTIWSDTGTNTGYKVTLDTSDRLVLSAGNGTAYTSAVRTGALTDGTDYVVMAWHDGTNLNVSVNNGAATQQAFVTATAGTAGFTIGRDNGAATGPFGARIYGAIYRKNDTSTAADRTSVASYLATKGGVTL